MKDDIRIEGLLFGCHCYLFSNIDLYFIKYQLNLILKYPIKDAQTVVSNILHCKNTWKSVEVLNHKRKDFPIITLQV